MSNRLAFLYAAHLHLLAMWSVTLLVLVVLTLLGVAALVWFMEWEAARHEAREQCPGGRRVADADADGAVGVSPWLDGETCVSPSRRYRDGDA